ncbi:hypothetical protein [Rhodococcus sp. ZPP]|uniref:hypothetical protein n=1 Tax=Rhodococcus sp. ZPP TaxID=2749906 RepID=UPI001FCBBA56|nr:hypothetical protein [Rhodococcus sp. ZPP]
MSRGSVPRKKVSTSRPTRTDTTAPSAGAPRRSHPDSTASTERARKQTGIAKPTARKHPRNTGAHAQAHSRSTTPVRIRPLDTASRGTEHGPLSDAIIEWLKNTVHGLLDTARDRGDTLTQKIQQRIRKYRDTLVDPAAHGNAGVIAGLEALRAVLTGKSPVWAATKALVSRLSSKTKIIIVLLLILGLLLGPVLLVVLLLALVVAAVVAAVRAAAR